MDNIFDFYANETAYPDLDGKGAVARLSRGIRFRTNSKDPAPDAFPGLHAYIRDSFPAVMEAGTCEQLRNSLLITIPGADPSLRPAMFMAHMDVVPVVPGTEEDWDYPPYSGALAEDCIWGRGSVDIKQQVFGSLEAAEYLLRSGKKPDRTLILAFGDDEETFNEGSAMICRRLQERNTELEFLLDEGRGKVYDAAAFGAPGVAVCNINLMEKGYADLELRTCGRGGHSSNPFGDTSLAVLSAAIAAICADPFPTRVDPLLRSTLLGLRDVITEEPLRTLLSPDEPDWDGVGEFCRSNRELFPYITTTIAPTVIEGGSTAPNVLPQDMRAVINFRLAQGTDPEEVLAHCKAAVNDERVELRYLQANPASIVTDCESYGYRRLTDALKDFYPRVRFLPMATPGATDARSYEPICGVCLRCSPFLITEETLNREHGTNERLPIRAYLQGIRVLIRFMERTLFNE